MGSIQCTHVLCTHMLKSRLQRAGPSTRVQPPPGPECTGAGSFSALLARIRPFLPLGGPVAAD